MRERKRLRLAGFDYSSRCHYFVTICVKEHKRSFGSIENKSMHLSANGIIAREQWQWLGNQYPYINLVSFVIMPDHVHGIIYIDADYYIDATGNGRDHSPHHQNNNPPKIKPLPELIGAYKTTVSKRIHMAGDLSFKWQNSYHDWIIRNDLSLNRIKKYINTNPENWME
jgi:REP element-mobilizing transposase RayT